MSHLPKISPELINKYQEELSQSFSEATLKRKLISVKKFLDWAGQGEIAFQTSGQQVIPAKYAGKFKKLPGAMFLNVAILVILSAALGYGIYNQFFKETKAPVASPLTALNPPKRYLSFQGRLTDQYGNPITSAKTVVFQLFDSAGTGNPPTGGTNLWDSGNCTVSPDTDGIFSVMLGTTSGDGYTCASASELTSSVFAENSEVWLHITTETQSMDPRIQIATVAYALNSETLQGYPASSSATINTVPVMNNLGQIILAASSPKIKSTAGNFAVEGQAITINTPSASNGNITISPDGTGQLNLTFTGASPGAGGGMVNATDANLTSGALYYGSVANNASGYNLLQLQSGSSPTDKFVVSSTGAVTTGIWNGTAVATQYGGTGQNWSSVAQGSLPYFDGTGTMNVLAPTTSNYVLTTQGAAANPQWKDVTTLVPGSTNYWALGTGTIYPGNTTMDLLLGNGATASAKFAFTGVAGGTPTASISGSTANVATFIDGNGNISSTNRNNITIGNSATYNSTGNILLNPNGTGNVGIGTTNPTYPLQVYSSGINSSSQLVLGASAGSVDVASGIFRINTINTGNHNQTLTLQTMTLSYGGTYSVKVAPWLNFGATAGRGTPFLIQPTVNQTATDSVYTALDINPFITASAGTANYLANFQVGNYSKAVITDTGRIGIGTTTPLASLDVNGGLKPSLVPTGTTVFNDTFTEAGATTLASHTPDTGTSWTRILNTGATTYEVGAGTGVIRGTTVADGGALYTADTTLSTADYEVNIYVGALPGTTNVAVLAARIQDTNNMYAFKFSSAVANSGLYKKSGGVWTLLSAATSGLLSGDTVRLRVVGNNIAVYRNNNVIASAVDPSPITAAGSAGLGIGSVVVSTDDASATWSLDNFNVIPYDSSTTVAAAIFNNGNVGIGTTTPAVSLDVTGNFNLTGYATMSGSLALGNTTALAGPGNLNASGRITGVEVYQGANQVCDTSGNCSSIGNFWQLNSNVLSPANATAYDLAVGGTSTAAAKFLVNAATGNITSSGSASVSGNLTLGNGSAIQSAYGPLTLNYKSGPSAYTAGLTLTNSGYVGIGTTDPTARLSVATNSGTPDATVLNLDNAYTAANRMGDVAISFSSAGSVFSRIISDHNTVGAEMSSLLKFYVSNVSPTLSLILTSEGLDQIGTAAHSIKNTSGDLTLTSNSNKITLNDSVNVVGYATASGSLALGNTTALAGPGNLNASGRITGVEIYQGASQVCDVSGNCSSIGNFWQLNNHVVSPANVTDYDLAVGGTSTASAKFQVLASNGNIYSAGSASVSGNLTLGNGSALQSAFGPVTLNYKSGADAYTAGLTLTNSGYVGIGTSTPGSKLEVSGDIFLSRGADRTIKLVGNPTGNGDALTISAGDGDMGGSGAGGNLNLTAGDAGDAAGGSIYLSAGDGAYGAGSAYLSGREIHFNSGSSPTEHMTLTQAGYFGIGTTSPTALFDVAGAASVSGSLSFRAGAGSIQTTAFNPLTIGGNTTGNITLNPSNAVAGGYVAPNTTNVTDLGTASLLWRNIRGTNLYQGANAVCDTSGNCSSIGNYWQLNNHVVSPANVTDYDLAVGGTSTASAKFQVLASNGNITSAGTASISGNLTLGNGSAIQSAYGPLTLKYKSGADAYTAGLTLTNSGYVGIGTTTPNGLLNVYSTTNDTTRLISLQGNSGTDRFFVQSNGAVRMNNLQIDGGSSVLKAVSGDLTLEPSAGNTIVLNDLAYNATTAVTQTAIETTSTFNPTSGVAVYNTYTLSPTINQTGGASGITRGIYINPTLSSANAWRSLEIANNTGFGIYESGTAANYFAGNVGIGTDAPSQALDVSGNFNLTGYATMSGSLALGNTTALTGPGNLNASGRITGVEVYQGANQVCDVSGNCSSIGNYWQLTDNSVAPANTTFALNVGSTASSSAFFHVPGTNNADAWFNLGTGNLGIGTTSPLATLDIFGNLNEKGSATISASYAGGIPLVVKGATSQTANLQQWQNSTGTVLGSIDAAGRLVDGAGSNIYNNFIGTGSGGSSINGASAYYTVGIGAYALGDLTSGTQNVAIGGYAGDKITTGNNNVAFGYQSLFSNQGGLENFAMGFQSLYGTTGSYNVGLGSKAGYSNTSGAGSTYIGKSSGYLNAGAYNIFLGYFAGYNQTAASNRLIIDNQQRASIAEESTNSILYGVMAAAPANQTLSINAATAINGYATVSASLALGNTTAAMGPGNLNASGRITGVQVYQGANQVCDTSGNCSSVGNFWQLNNHVLSPANYADYDLAVGGTATASSKFQIMALTGNLYSANNTIDWTLNNAVDALNIDSSTLSVDASNDRIGIGTGAPSQKLHVNGNILSGVAGTTTDNSIAGVLNGTDTNTYYAGLRTIQDSSNNRALLALGISLNSLNIPSSFVIQYGGNVGIGTSTPTTLLDVAGAASVSGSLSFRAGAGSIQTTTFSPLTIGGATTGNITLNPSNAVAGGYVAPATTNVSDLGTASLLWRNIRGTTLYQGANQVCDVSGNCSSIGNFWQLNNHVLSPANHTDYDLAVGGTSTASAKFQVLASNGNITSTGTASVSGNLTLGNGSALQSAYGPLTLNYKSGANAYTAGLTLTNSGSVGVGTTTPSEKLTVAGNISLEAVTSGYSDISFTRNSDGWNPAKIRQAFGPYGTAGNLSFWVNNNSSLTEAMRILYNGDIGIGTSTPTAKLDIVGSASTSGTLAFRGTTNPKIDILNAENLGFRTSPSGDAGLTERLTILNSGNVGIGTPTPGSLLDVAGGTPVTLQLRNGGSGTPTTSQIAFSYINTEQYRHAISSSHDNAGKGSNYLRFTIWNQGVDAAGTVGTLEALRLGGVGAVFNEGSEDLDFRIESDTDLYAFNLDGATGNIGMGASAPTAKLDVAGAASVSGSLSFRAGAGSIQTTTFSPLTIGGATTGNITLNPSNAVDGGSVAPGTTNVSTLGTASLLWKAIYGTALYQGANQVCDVSGNCSSIGNFWQLNNHILSPANYADYDLAVGGTSTAAAKFIVNAATGNLTGAGTASVSGNLTLGNGSAIQSAFGPLTLNYKSGADAYTAGLTLTNSGYVGIGTTAPGAALSVSGNFTGSNYGVAQIYLRDTGASNAWVSLSASTNASVKPYMGTTSNHPFYFVTNNAYRWGAGANGGISFGSSYYSTDPGANNVIIQGNVGIGTTAPIASLDIEKGYGGNAAAIINQNLSGNILAASSSGTPRFTLNNSGEITLLDSVAHTIDDISGDLTLTSNSTSISLNDNVSILGYATASASLALGNTTAAIGPGHLNMSGNLTVGGTTTLGTRTYTWPTSESAGVLTSNGSGGLSWAAAGGGTNYWNLGTGTIYPGNLTMDLLLGSGATSSAKFAFKNVFAGTPTASISGSTANVATFIDGNGNMSTTNRQDLTLGNSATYNSTGNILLNPNGTGRVGINTTSPNSTLDLGTSGILTIGTNSSLHSSGSQIKISGTVGQEASLQTSTDTPAVRSGLSLIKTRGSVSSPTAVVSGDTVGFFGFKGYDGSATVLTGLVQGYVDDTVSSSTVPMAFDFITGTTTANRTARLTIRSSGNVGIGTTSPTVPLDVAGAASVSGTLTVGDGATNTIRPTFGPLNLAYKSGANAWTTGLTIKSPSGDVDIAGGSGSTGCTVTNSSGNLVCTGTISGSGIVATSVPFSGITTATNNSGQTLTVGDTSSLTYSGTGTINASSLIGATWAAPGTIGSGTPNTGAFTTLSATGNVTMNDAGADNILIGAAADTLTLTSNALSATDDNWSITAAGLANFVSVGAGTPGTGAFTTLSSTTLSASSYATISASLALGNTTAAFGPGHLNMSGNLTVGGTTTLGTRTYTWPTSESAGVLTSNGSGGLSWAAASAGGQWTLGQGILYPNNQTADVFIGGTATTSAKFAFKNVLAGTPTASISGSTANVATFIDGNGNMSSTNRNNLTLGNSSTYNTTGNILLNPNGTGFVGIGYTTPASALDVAGGALATEGADKVTNGGFDTDTVWTKGTDWAIGSSVATKTAGTASNLSQDTTEASGDVYHVTFTFTRTAGTLSLSIGGTTYPTSWAYAGGTVSIYVYSAGTGDLTFIANSAFAGTIDTVSVTPVVTSLANTTFRDSAGTIKSELRIGGTSNNFFGKNSGKYNLSAGTYNSAFGDNSLVFNASGDNNAAFGEYSLYNNVSGSSNTALGENSMVYNTSGDQNVAVGTSALLNNVSGSRNIALGYAALYDNDSAWSNIAIGYSALSNTSGWFQDNVAVGSYALDNVSGNFNVAVGDYAGEGLGNGSYNTFVGQEAGFNASQLSTAQNSMALGYDAYTTKSNQVVLGNSNVVETLLRGIVGIGTTSPLSRLSVVNNPAGGSLTGKAAALFDQYENEDIFTASASGATKMKLAYDGTLSLYNATSSIANSSGDISLDAASNFISFSGDSIGNIDDITAAGVLNAGGITGVAYNGFGGGGDSPASTAITTSNDLFVGGDLELKGGLYLTGRNIYNVVGGVSTGTIAFAANPATTDNYNTLGYGSWMASNGTNPGIAAFMVNQDKGGDIFTASVSGVTKFKIDHSGNVGIGTGSTLYATLTLESTAENTLRFTDGDSLRSIIGIAAGSGQITTGSVDNDLVLRNQSGKIMFTTDGGSNTTMTLTGGNLGLGTVAPTNIISLGNTAAQKFWIENTASGTVGRALTVAAGGTVAGSTDITGGNLILQSGLGTGTGASTISFQTGTTLTTGTTLQTMSTKMTILGNGNVGIGTVTPTESLHTVGFGLASRGFMSYDSYWAEEFSYDDADGVADAALAFGDNNQFSFDENTNGGYFVSDDRIGGVGGISTQLNTSSLAYLGSSTVGNAHLIHSVSNLPTALIKAKPWTQTTNVRYWIGLMDRTSAANADPTNGVFFATDSVGGANWYGKVCSGGTCSTTASCGVASSTQYATLMIRVNSTSSVNFYVDIDASDGVAPTNCGELTTNIPSTGITPEFQIYSTDASIQSWGIDYFRVWQDDPVSGGDSLGTYQTSVYDPVAGSDLAENYPTVESTEIVPGTIVSASSGDLPFVQVSRVPNDTKVIGIVSTSPAQTIGDGGDMNMGMARVALVGRVPVRIDPTSKPIKAGDYIVSSGNEGMGRKAIQSGIAIGKALEDWTPESGKETILVFVNLSSFDSDVFLANADDVNIVEGQDLVNPEKTTFSLKNLENEIVTKIGAFAQLVAANIKAGAITTAEIATNSFTAFQGTVDNLLVKSGLVAVNIQTKLISPIPGEDLAVQLTPDSKFKIQDSDALEVASIDSAGNATFSGTLYADNIKSQSLDDIHALLTKVETDQDILKSVVDWNTLNATNSASLDQIATADLYVTNQAAINSLSVTNSLAVGTDLIFGSVTNDQSLTINSIDTLSAPLRIQSLAMAPVEIMAGLVTIDTNGNVNIAGNLNVAGRINSSGLTLSAITTDTATESANLLSLKDASGNEVSSVNASGSAQFNNLVTGGLTIASNNLATTSALVNGVITTNATAGQGIIPTGVSEITIKNPKVTDYTLVYVTPTSSTQNYVLYVKSKENGKFVVGFTNPIDVDVNFNWWIVQISQ